MFHDNQEVPNINGYQQINWVFHVDLQYYIKTPKFLKQYQSQMDCLRSLDKGWGNN